MAPIRWVVAGIAVLVIVFAGTLTPTLVIVTAVVALAVIGILQLVSTPPDRWRAEQAEAVGVS